MKHGFPQYIGGHMAALAGAAAIHAGVAAWAMAPRPPVAIPQQQVIQITMVAPTVIQQEETPQPVQEAKKELPKTPPKEIGMVKVEPKPKPIQKAEKKPEKQEQPRHTAQRTQLTSGLQSREATETKAAITEPVAAAYLNNPPPEYPDRARTRRQQGVVMLEVRVTTEGKPGAVEISRSSGYKLLDMAALDAVRQWKFIPARRGSQLVEASVVIPVEFRIN